MLVLLLAHLPAVLLVLGGKFGPALAALAAGHAFLLAGTLVPRARLFGRVVTRRPHDGTPDALWLTFDDGPSPETTGPLLDLLDAADARATFFVIGSRARRHPDLVREIVRRGHQLGNHTATHPATRFWRLGPSGVHREIADAQRLLAAWGPPPVWFRAPAGMKNPFVHPVLRRLGLTLVAWTGRGFDGTDDNPDRIVARLAARIAPDATLVIHEGRPTTLDCTRRILARIDSAGLRCRPPDTASRARPPA